MFAAYSYINHIRHAINELTTRIAHDTAEDFNRLDSQALGNKQRRMQVERLKSNFAKVLKDYQQTSQQAADKQRQFVAIAKRKTQVAEPSSPPADERTSLLAQERMQMRMQQQALDSEIQYNDMLIKDREDSIRDIEGTILEINSLFKDLAQTVTMQGEMVGMCICCY